MKIFISLFMFLSINLFGQSNNDIYIQYLNEKNIEYQFDISGNIMFKNKYRIITNSGIFGISENSNRNRNYFQIIRVARIGNIMSPELFIRINQLINFVNSQVVMGKIFLSSEGNTKDALFVISSEIILNDPKDFVNYIDIMCETIDIILNLYENNINRVF